MRALISCLSHVLERTREEFAKFPERAAATLSVRTLVGSGLR
jgi:hypothetical protein